MKLSKDSVISAVKNNKNILVNILGAFVVKGGSMLLTLFLLPAYIRFFGNDNVLGIWYTILSIINWVLVFDFGIGHGLRNKLPKALANNDMKEGRSLVSSTYIASAGLVVIIGIIGSVAIHLINWNAILNINESDLSLPVLRYAIQIAFIGVLIQFVLKLVTSILYAIQKSGLVNFLTFLSNVIIFIVINLLPSGDTSSNIIAISYFNILAVNLPLLVVSMILFLGKFKDIRPSFKFWSKDSAKSVLKIGVTLLWLQLIFMIISSTNEFLITAFCGPAAVVDYQVYFKIFNSVAAICSLVLIPIWSAVTKAKVEKRYTWIRKTYMLLLGFSVLALLVLLGIVLVLQPIVNFWLKDDAITVTMTYGVIFALSGFIFLVHNVNTSIGNGFSYFKPQIVLMTLAAVLDIPLAWVFVKLTGGMIGVVLANIIVLIPFEVLEPIFFFRYLNKLIKSEGKTE